MSSPSWRQFAAIPFDATVAAVVKALDLEIPEEGRPRSFRGPGGQWPGGQFLASTTQAGDWVICHGGASRFVDGPGAVLKAARMPAGTPSGDALRQWLRWWGWAPRSEQRQAEPQEQTKTII